MDQQQIKTFIDAMAASDLDEMEVSHEGWTLRLVRHRRGGATHADAGAQVNAAAVPQPAVTPAAAAIAFEAPVAVAVHDLQDVQAPLFGVVHLRPSPGEPPFVQAGDTVEEGQMLCTIEAMKVFNEVRAQRPGRVTTIHVASGAEVEAGQALMRLERRGDV